MVAALSFLLFRRGLLSPARFDPALFRAAIAFGLPLILYEVASIALGSADRVLVRYYLGAEPLGYYSVAYGLSYYINDLLIAPLNLALLPIYMRLWVSEGRERTIEFLSAGLDLFLIVAAGVFAVAAVASRDAVILLASSKYRGAGSLMPMLVAGLLVYTTHVFLSAGLLIQKKTGQMARLLLYSALCNIGLNCVLLPRMGLPGATVATLVSNAFCILLLGRASFKILPLRISLRGLLRYALAAAVAWGAASHVELGSAFLDFACRSAVAVLLYASMLYLLDSRVRAATARLLPRGSRRVDSGSAAPEVASAVER
jgi:O-antigen/teichoic acid export membrane protein